jgi:nicotinamidase-related amidase
MGIFDTNDEGDVSPGTAVLIIDMINDFQFEDAERLFENAVPVAGNIGELKVMARQAGLPVIYVNDNFGKWHSDLKKILGHVRKSEKGRQIADVVAPDDDDYFVLKPMHSGFYSTALHLLLEHLKISRLILTGITSDICILFTANDAYMRGYELYIPADCVAAVEKQQNDYALKYMERVLKADIRSSAKLDLVMRRTAT